MPERRGEGQQPGRYALFVRSGLNFVVAGVPVRVLPTFFLVSLLLGLGYGDALLVGLWGGVVFASVLVHELGHAGAYRRFGSDAVIVLHSFGGLTVGRSLPAGRELVVSLAGPASNLLIGVPLLVLDHAGPVSGSTSGAVLAMAIWVNVGWGLLNLVPILPLDGGRALAALLSLVTRRDATRAVHAVSVVTAAVAVYLAVQLGLVFAAALAAWFLVVNAQAFGRRAGHAPGPPAVPVTQPRSLASAGLHPAASRPPVPPASVAPPVPVAPPAEPVGRERKDPAGSPATEVRSRPVMPGHRSLDDEVGAAIRAVAGNEPELALIAIARMRAHGLTPEQTVRTDELEAWAWMQRGDLASAEPFIEAVPPDDPARALLEAGRAGLAGEGWERARQLADPHAEGAQLSARFLATLLPADGVQPSDVEPSSG